MKMVKRTCAGLASASLGLTKHKPCPQNKRNQIDMTAVPATRWIYQFHAPDVASLDPNPTLSDLREQLRKHLDDAGHYKEGMLQLKDRISKWKLPSHAGPPIAQYNDPWAEWTKAEGHIETLLAQANQVMAQSIRLLQQLQHKSDEPRRPTNIEARQRSSSRALPLLASQAVQLTASVTSLRQRYVTLWQTYQEREQELQNAYAKRILQQGYNVDVPERLNLNEIYGKRFQSMREALQWLSGTREKGIEWLTSTIEKHPGSTRETGKQLSNWQARWDEIASGLRECIEEREEILKKGRKVVQGELKNRPSGFWPREPAKRVESWIGELARSDTAIEFLTVQSLRLYAEDRKHLVVTCKWPDMSDAEREYVYKQINRL